MSSVLRSIAQKKEGLTKFMKVISAAYYNGNENVLFPFVYYNNTLDITYEGNTFEQEMVDITGRSPQYEDEEVYPMIRILGGPRLVSAIGDNFKDYIRAWRAGTIDANSPIEVYIPTQVIRVQAASSDHLDENDSNYSVSTVPPVGDNYISGIAQTGYNTSYVFKTPLTITTMEGGVKQYITLYSVFDQE